MRRTSRWMLFGAVAALSCTKDTPTALRHLGSPSSVISDADHSGGNAHFFFLPPMVGQPTFNGTFDPSLSPVVEVCEWTTRCGQIVVRFTKQSGTGSATIRTDTSGQQYIVNWNTKQCTTGPCVLDATKTYRIRVLVATVLLGFADVELVNNGSQLKNVKTSDYVALVDGSTLPLKFRIEVGAIHVVPATGGAVQIDPSQGGIIATAGGEVVLSIPPNALPATTTTITVTPRSAAGLPTSPPIVPGTLFDFGPNGTQFATPITMKLAYDLARIPAGIREGNLRLYTYDAGSGSWQRVPGSHEDLQAHFVSGPVTHFSTDVDASEPPPDGVALVDIAGGLIGGQVRNVFQLGDTLWNPGHLLDGLEDLGIGDGFMALAFSQAEECYYQYDRVLSYAMANAAVATVDSVTHVHTNTNDVNGGLGIGLPCAGPDTAQTWVPWITPRSVGTTYLRVSFDGYVDSLRVVVTPPQVANQALYINGQPASNWFFTPPLGVGQTATYSITPTTSWGAPLPDKTINFAIDNPAIATLTPATSQSVTVAGVASGCTWLSETVDTLRGRIAVNVPPVPVDFAGATWGSPMTMNHVGCGVVDIPSETMAQPLRWSPDGVRIAWRSANYRSRTLYVANADGSGLQGLPINTYPTSFSWSPDGTRIAYAGYDATSGDAEIHIVNVSGSSDQVITTTVPDLVADCPEWSPDGTEIVFQRGKFTLNYSGSTFDEVFTLWATRSVYVIKADGTNERLIVSNDGMHSASFPRWAPDGSRIAYLDATTDGMVRLMTIRPDGTGSSQVSQPFYLGDESNYNRHYAWAPDGQKFELDEGSSGTFVMSLEGTSVIQLPSGQYSLQPWSADSRQLMFTNGDRGAVARVNADGTVLTQILPNWWIGVGLVPSWRPTVASVP